ncbi:MAG TPA: hypothetical protein VIV11_14120 [Kofleriaceae bacterium]
MTWLSAVAIVLALSSSAAAQAPGDTAPLSPAPASPPAREKNPTTAMALSIGTTMAGFAVLAASEGEESAVVIGIGGMYLGPSTGQWYAGRIGGIGLVSRAVSAYLIVRGVSQLDHGGHDCLGLTDAECDVAEESWARESNHAEALIWTGVGLWVGSTIYDFVMAGRATDAWNRKHAVTLAPMAMRTSAGRAPGVTLQLTF